MNRGGSSGGGQSSLGYLFGSGEAPKPTTKNTQAAPCEAPAENKVPATKPNSVSPPVDITKQIPAGFRADNQNIGTFITERPSTKVHNAPGGGSSLGYLFGGGGASN